MSQKQVAEQNEKETTTSSAQTVIAPTFHGAIYTQHLHTGLGDINITGTSSGKYSNIYFGDPQNRNLKKKKKKKKKKNESGEFKIFDLQ